MGPKHFQDKARHEWWSIQIEAWQRSGLSQRAYGRRHRLDQGTFSRWLKVLAGEEAARKLTEYRMELRREKRREEREKGLRKTRRQRFAISTDVRHRGLQAFRAMHVEAMNWSGTGVREYAARCPCRRTRCAHGVTGWMTAKLKSTGVRIFTPPPAPSLGLVLRNRSPKAA